MESGREFQAGLQAMSGKSLACGGKISSSFPSPSAAVDIKMEQNKLAGVVKSVHRSLRKKYREAGDFEKVWHEHCKDEGRLCEYAAAMKNLASNHWSKKCEGQSRIEWCLRVCQEYFYNGGKKKALEKDSRRAALNNQEPPNYAEYLSVNPFCVRPQVKAPNNEFHPSRKIRLLDVGSCYNPFLKYDDILSVGIDIVPAVETVHRCDFLNLQIQKPLQFAPEAIDAFLRRLQSPIDYLPAELFDVVVFSLLLSYFPSRYQRWICCKKAHELLTLNGLLLIITPDSSHQNRNAMMMKSWKISIESLGFKRMVYSKIEHMHLMAFRKTSRVTTIDLITRNYPSMLYIPQDFKSVEEGGYHTPTYSRSHCEDEEVAFTFSEMPDTPYDSDSAESQSSSKSFHGFEEPVLLMS
ncbi:S-adenosylmethionine sensor upstream of mTORC1 [Pelodytes ibericus]